MFQPGALRWDVTIGAGHKQVQLPTGFAYDAGKTVTLTQRQVEQLDPAAFEGQSPYLVDLEPHSPIEVAGREYEVSEVTEE